MDDGFTKAEAEAYLSSNFILRRVFDEAGVGNEDVAMSWQPSQLTQGQPPRSKQCCECAKQEAEKV